MITHGLLSIKNLQLSAVIGAKPAERLQPQALLLDLTFNQSITAAAASDQLSDTIDYEQLSQRLAIFVANTRHALIETLAVAIATWLKKEYGLTQISLTLKKPSAIAKADYVSITINQLVVC